MLDHLVLLQLRHRGGGGAGQVPAARHQVLPQRRAHGEPHRAVHAGDCGAGNRLLGVDFSEKVKNICAPERVCQVSDAQPRCQSSVGLVVVVAVFVVYFLVAIVVVFAVAVVAVVAVVAAVVVAAAAAAASAWRSGCRLCP